MATQFRNVRTGIAVALGLVVLSCDKSPTSPSPPPQPLPPPPVFLARIDVTGPASIELQKSAQLTATGVKSDGSTEDITSQASWSTSNPSLVQVTATGLATGLKAGEVTITVRYQTRTGTTRILALPAGTYKLTGRITESGFPISGVRVTVISGLGDGLATTTSGDGSFVLYGVAGRVKLQAKKDGYINRIEEFDVGANTTHDFEIVPERQRVNLAGTYSLNLEAKCSSTSVPEALKRRSYTATVEQQGPDVTVRVSGADFIVTNGQGNSFLGTVEPTDTAAFRIGELFYYYYYYYYSSARSEGLVERIGPTTALIVSGVVSARVTTSSILGILDGSFQMREGTGPFFQFSSPCRSRSHSFEMRRR